jgi:hypothetical protein
MLKTLSSMLFAVLMGVLTIANAEFRSNDNDGFAIPKPKKPSEQKARGDGHQDPMQIHKEHAQENDGIKRPDNTNSSISNKRPSKDEDFSPDQLDGIKRPKKDN